MLFFKIFFRLVRQGVARSMGVRESTSAPACSNCAARPWVRGPTKYPQSLKISLATPIEGSTFSRIRKGNETGRLVRGIRTLRSRLRLQSFPSLCGGEIVRWWLLFCVSNSGFVPCVRNERRIVVLPGQGGALVFLCWKGGGIRGVDGINARLL